MKPYMKIKVVSQTQQYKTQKIITLNHIQKPKLKKFVKTPQSNTKINYQTITPHNKKIFKPF